MSGTEAFLKVAVQAPLVVLTDFDYTVTEVDVGDLIIQRLSPPSKEVEARFAAREVGTRVFWCDSIAHADLTEAKALAGTVRMDPHFASFAAWCEEAGIPLAVVSDGFGYYIEVLFRREGIDLPVFCNEMTGPGELQFPHGNPACDFCGCCKAQVARRIREAGARVVYLGDGVSDLYAAGFADWIFARGRLARHLAEHGSPYFPLSSFAEVQHILRENLDLFRSGQMERRSLLRPDPRCRF